MSANANPSEVWGILQDILKPGTAPARPRVRRFPVGSIFWGVLAPIGCLALQPWLSSLQLGDDFGYSFLACGYFNEYWVFGYGFLGLEMLALLVRLALGRRLGVWNGVLAGVLCTGALFAFLQGLVLLPLSIVGLFLLIGALGFVPFATGLAFLLHAEGAMLDARRVVGTWRLARLALLGAALVIGLPLAAQWPVATAMESALNKTANGDPNAIEPFVRWTPLALKHRVFEEWRRETSRDRKECFDQAYERLTGITASERQARIDAD